MDALRPLIVIVEDDDFAAFLFERVLTSQGYDVSIARGDADSMAALSAREPSALLIDLHLGETDGLKLLRRLRAVPSFRNVPAALITGDYFTDAAVSRELESLGVDMYLKPIWDDELLRVVAGLLKRRPAPAPEPRRPGPTPLKPLTH